MRRRSSLLTALGVVLILLAAGQLLATPVARWYVRRELASLQGLEGRVGDVHASLLPPYLSVAQLSLIEQPNGNWREPLLYTEHARVSVDLKSLLRGRLAARARLEKPKINYVQVPTPPTKKKKAPPPDLSAALVQMAPLRVDVLQVDDGGADFVDRTQQPAAEIWIHDVQLSLANLATRPRLSQGKPTLDLKARVQHSGELTVHAVADPWAQGLTFAGRAELLHLDARDIQAVIESGTDLKPASGSIDVFADFRCNNGTLSGGVKPIAHDLKLAPGKSGTWTKVKSWLSDAAIDLFGRKEPDNSKEVATIVPIEGRISDPNAEVWPTVLGVVRNAFVEAIERGFQNLPPKVAPQPQSPAQQAANALKKNNGPPEAQPPQARTPPRK